MYFVDLSDSIALTSSLVAHKPGPQEAVRVTDDDGRSIAMDVSEGQIALSLRANKRPNETSDLEVCRILVTRLNRDGGRWEGLVHLKSSNRDEAGVDCRADDGDSILNIQVTRASGDPAIWSNVNVLVPIERVRSDSAYAEELRDAIVRKETKPKQGIILALDSIETPHIASSVIGLFETNYGEWVRSLGFRAIWVVGPSPELTFRLDGE
jgi:hypothetical protein